MESLIAILSAVSFPEASLLPWWARCVLAGFALSLLVAGRRLPDNALALCAALAGATGGVALSAAASPWPSDAGVVVTGAACLGGAAGLAAHELHRRLALALIGGVILAVLAQVLLGAGAGHTASLRGLALCAGLCTAPWLFEAWPVVSTALVGAVVCAWLWGGATAIVVLVLAFGGGLMLQRTALTKASTSP